jgi:hypothetical protein
MLYVRPSVGYCRSDTNYLPLINTNAEIIFQYPIIVIECTFLEKEDLHHAKKKNHMHWEYLFPIVQSHPLIKFILIHFSKRYKWPEIKNFFDRINSLTPLNNVILWLHPSLVDYSKINLSGTACDNVIEI